MEIGDRIAITKEFLEWRLTTDSAWLPTGYIEGQIVAVEHIYPPDDLGAGCVGFSFTSNLNGMRLWGMLHKDLIERFSMKLEATA